jgi:8-oxo-dGTP pyrophosphatase MutT (NUDIX family)
VAYRAVRDAPPIEVSMAWWANNPPARLEELLALAREVFRGATAEVVAATWICVRDGRLLVVRPAGQEAFFLPGGKPEPGETPVEAAVREVREETGIRLRPEQLTHFAEIIRPAYGRRDTNVHLICFTGPGHGTAEPAGEIAEVAWFTAADALRCAPAIQEIITRLTRQNLMH